MRLKIVVIVNILLSMVLATGSDIIQAIPTAADSTSSNLIIEADGSSQGLMLFGRIQPLTQDSGDTLSIAGLQTINEVGLLTLWDGEVRSAPTDQDIRFLSCDADDSADTNLTSRFLNATVDNPYAVLLYSTSQNTCSFLGKDNRTYYQSVFTMTSMSVSKTFEQSLNASIGKMMKARMYYNATVNGNATSNSATPNNNNNNNNNNNGNNGNNGNNQSGNGQMIPGPSTAVAMIILYSITGLITFLFLTVVLVGAIRAHRHPDRYGPRAGGTLGGPRQSRAKGIARAVLEGLPIVRFHDSSRDDAVPKPEDLEMNGAGSANGTNVPQGEIQSTLGEGEATTSVNQVPRGAGTAEESQNLTDSVRNSVANSGRNSLMNPLQKDCPICLTDFEGGQDLRVLPCHATNDVEGGESSQAQTNTTDVITQTQPIRFSRYIDVIRLTSSSSPERLNALRQLREDLLARQRQRRASRSSMASHTRTSSLGGAFASTHRRTSSAAGPNTPTVEGEDTDGTGSSRWRMFSSRRRTLDNIVSPVVSPAEVNETAPIAVASSPVNTGVTTTTEGETPDTPEASHLSAPRQTQTSDVSRSSSSQHQ